MASVDWQKHSGGTSVKAQFRHCDKDERLKAEHANEEIDKSLTYKNLSFGAFNGDYKSICHAYDERIKYIDEHAGLKKKPRKDRVTCMSWSISCPAGMSDDMASKWFTDVYDLLNTEYSDVLGASAHFDEVHEYVDAANTKKQKAKPSLTAPKPVDYAQKALGVMGEQLVDKAVHEVHEVAKRKTLSTPPSWDEQSGDELSY